MDLELVRETLAGTRETVSWDDLKAELDERD